MRKLGEGSSMENGWVILPSGAKVLLWQLSVDEGGVLYEGFDGHLTVPGLPTNENGGAVLSLEDRRALADAMILVWATYRDSQT